MIRAALLVASLAVGTDMLAGLRLVDLEGREWTADRLSGRVTLIDFWATWCAPCLEELPFLKRAHAQFSRDELEIIGVSFDRTDRRTFVSWLNRQGVAWPQVFDGRGRHTEVARRFGVTAVPMSFLLNAEGEIVARNLRGERLLHAIADEVHRLHQRRSGRHYGTSTSNFDAARVPIVIR